jgi:hypothetical protein
LEGDTDTDGPKETVSTDISKVGYGGVGHGRLDLTVSSTTSVLLLIGTVMNFLLVFICSPFSFQFTIGFKPPPVKVALKVTYSSEHILFALFVRLSDAGVGLNTFIFFPVDSTDLGLAQPELEVNSHVYSSFIANVLVKYKSEVAPDIRFPFKYH